MSERALAMEQAGFGRTARRDAWWVQPAATFAVFSVFIVYSTWASAQGEIRKIASEVGGRDLADLA